ncbi:MAG TPA: DegT/DnrJ/EryC1/StrS family aminotransferase [Bryobacteraceae bacterium]|nr:DegT/DnrJ/EryC1/StrS family aminotransferase [Bryobacteraceae bacterium]
MIPFGNLQEQYRSIKPEIDQAILGALETSQFILGPEVAAFEREFAAYCGAREGIGVNSGTSALHLALLAAGAGPGDEVITVPFTFVATVAAICYTGAAPVYVDIDPQSNTMDPAKLEAAITPRTKVILPVHLYGHPADMDPIIEVARRRGIAVIEDAAQAHGSQYKGRPVGSLGDMACYSFYPGKNLGAYGEGGMVVTSNPEYAGFVRKMRDWGQSRRYYHDLRGFNYRLEGMQGAILRVKLRHLEAWTEARRANAAIYGETLAGLGVGLPREMPSARHVYHVYAIRVPHRDAVVEAMTAAGVQTGIHYPIPVHLQNAYRDERYPEGSFPVAETVAREVLSLPMFPELTRAQIEEVAEAVRASVSAADG